MYIHEIVRNTLAFTKSRFKDLKRLTIHVDADKPSFESHHEFEHYFKEVEPKEEVAFIKGYIYGRNANKLSDEDHPDNLVPLPKRQTNEQSENDSPKDTETRSPDPM